MNGGMMDIDGIQTTIEQLEKKLITYKNLVEKIKNNMVSINENYNSDNDDILWTTENNIIKKLHSMEEYYESIIYALKKKRQEYIDLDKQIQNIFKL